jgi:hypothetical protein
MKLLLWLSALFATLTTVSDTPDPQLEELDVLPHSERFPAYPHQPDVPVDPLAQDGWDRVVHSCLYF